MGLKSFKTSDINPSFRRFVLFQNVGFVVYFLGFFEDLAVRGLSMYADLIQVELKHYRDSSGREVDAIVEPRNGNYAAIEIKIYSDENIKNAFASLKKFEKALKQDGLKFPQFKMVLTSHGPCYRKDGIYVVPITMLKN